jgi:CMP-N,N'-diacetyllegionaminic acid synthase
MAETLFNSLAIIPARAGSKGVPGKNIRLLDGKPLIAYAIETALQSKYIGRCIVNTDSEEIATVAKAFGAEVMMRSPGQADDDSPVVPVIIDTLTYADVSAAIPFDIVVLLQPTAPLRSSNDINAAIEMFSGKPAPDAVISVVEVGDAHPARMYQLDDDNQMRSLQPAHETQRRQDLIPLYLRNGCIYAIRSAILKKEQTLMPANKQAYIMPATWQANIDTERDFLFAEILMKEWKQRP